MRFLIKLIKNKIFLTIIALILIVILSWIWPQEKVKPNYGTTFSVKYAKELKLNPEETLEKIITELNMKKIRMVAYWDDIENEEGVYNFTDLDWQIEMAEKYDAEIVLAVGKRVPRWPECHIPYWALQSDKEKQDEALLKFVREVLTRYKDSEVVKVWQIENEPFLTGYAKQYCGKLDKNLLYKEIALVKEIDPATPILITDSGELSLWNSAFGLGDHFGSTFYVYVANHFFDDVRSVMSHNVYLFKKSVMELIHGKKPSYLIEISIEPWLTKPIIQTPFIEQLAKMNVKRAKTILDIASQTGFEEQYLWGAEWWYYLKLNGHPEIWDYIKEINKL